MPKKIIGIFIFMLLIITLTPEVYSIIDNKIGLKLDNNIQKIYLDNMTELQKILPSDGASNDLFGNSVSINGDYAIIGSPRDNSVGEMSGSAYIFKRSGLNWTQEAKLIPLDGNAFDCFGNSVSLDGEYALIGAYLDDDKGVNSGSAYIFKRAGSIWSQQTKLIPSDEAEGNHFGYSVSINGTYALIGAKDDNDYGETSGSAYIFNREGSSWFQQAKIHASDGFIGDNFGYSVSINGEYALIGAVLDDDKETDSGSAYIFELFGTSWIQQAKLISPDGQEYDWFGYSVSIYSNYALIGTPNDDDNGNNSGSAYIFEYTGLIWTQEAKLLPIEGKEGDLFGCSVSLDDNNGLVGALLNDDNGQDSGAAYIFKPDGNKWTQQSKLFTSDGNSDDQFGKSVSISGDYQLVGVPFDDALGEKSGSAYIFLYSEPPNTPNITGPTKIKVDIGKEFIFMTTDPDKDQIYYYIDWGDGNTVDWQGPFSSGFQFKLLHNWSNIDTFTIRCKAKDVHDLESDWGIKYVSITRSRILNSPFLIFVQTHINIYIILQKLLNFCMQ